MGGSSDTVTGYKYYMGMHAVLCQSPIDAVIQLNFDEDAAWSGSAIGERITVNAPEIFGGDDAEGGFSGGIDILDGNIEQGRNDYLSARLEGLVPAFRGVVSMVFRRTYWGKNPYIKPFKVKVQNVYSTFENWLPHLAPIRPELSSSLTSFYIAMDNSESMQTGDRLATMQDGVSSLIETIPADAGNSVCLVSFGSSNDTAKRQWTNWDDDAKSEALAFIETMVGTGGATDFEEAVSHASSFFQDAHDANVSSKNWVNGILEVAARVFGDEILEAGGSTYDYASATQKLVYIITDGEPNPSSSASTARESLDKIDGVSVRGINIELSDTQYTEIMSDYPVPVISDGDSDHISSALLAISSSSCDLNPIHAYRHILLSPTANGKGDSSIIDDSFVVAAQTCFDEQIGFSFFWNDKSNKDAFKAKIEKHLNASFFVSRSTGLWSVKLIRPDYDVDDLPVFDKSVISAWPTPPTRPDQSELPNSITLVYTSREDGSETSTSEHNLAGIQISGGVIPETVTLEGITHDDVATAICQRELASRSSPAFSGAFDAAYLDPSIDIGDAIIIHEPRHEMYNVVCRITKIKETDGKDNSVTVTFVEDTLRYDVTDSVEVSVVI